ncbi:MAG: DUF4965 domain-containing protein [Clostridia bacterium]|nr:DUF4965 domain-containing protein [Clostridia bacterium]
MKLPAYPISTIDPHFSIWSRTDNINEGDTYLWCGIKKRITGTVTFDGESYRFLGNGLKNKIEQKEVRITPFVSEYIFGNGKFTLTFRTWSPFLFDDFHIMAAPVSYLECDIKALDGKDHSISAELKAYDELCLGKRKRQITKYTMTVEGKRIVRMGLTKQEPLNDSGDTYAPDWGYVCLSGEKVAANFKGIGASADAKAAEASFCFILAYDDVYSINYFGQKLKGLWTERFTDIEEAISFATENRDVLFGKIRAQEEAILRDSERFGEDYQKILSAAARQVMAGHKLVRNNEGQLLYLSKECHSNGCINTVDVSYPAMPMYLLYCPELIRAMVVGIFHFASMPLWKEDFAPHDIGRYPLACGQVYALAPMHHLLPHKIGYKRVYKNPSLGLYMPEFQMPVEECGNMIILCYNYYRITKDASLLEENFLLLEKWATYLKNAGVVLSRELCTDDFAGHSVKNVNLAIKGVMGIACFGKICEALGKENPYTALSKEYADKLVSECATAEGWLPFSIGKNETWSLKYNLVWDKIFRFGLFSEELYQGESDKYKDELNEYGVPLDYRKDFTKTDWMLWAACLDKDEENIKLFSERIVKYLADTEDRNCFSDWIETKKPKQSGFDHRTVQAGLWMPVLMDKYMNE